jgi:hypothetical protein
MKKVLLFMLVLGTGYFVSINAQIDIEEDVLLYLSFDDDLIDNDQGIEGTNMGAASAEGYVGDGAEFDGESYILMEPIPEVDLAAGMAFSWWMQSTMAEGQNIWGYSNAVDPSVDEWEAGGICAGTTVDDQMGIDIGWVGGNFEEPEPQSEAGAVTDGEWHHVVFVFTQDGAHMEVFIDGESVDIIEVENTFTSAGATPEDDGLMLGAVSVDWPSEMGGALYYTGSLDEFRIYNAELTAEDVTELYEFDPSGVVGIPSLSSFAVYPNPASEFIRVKSITPERDLSIFNSIGQVVLTERNVRNGTMIDVSDLTTGMYMVKSGEEIQKLIIK